RAKDHRLRIRVNVLVSNSLEQLARGDAGGGEEDVVARAKVVDRQDLVRLVPLFDGDLAVIVIAKQQLGLHVTAQGLDGTSGQDAFRRAARPHHAVDAESHLESRLERATHIAGGDQLYARADVADLGDDVGVSGSLEHD